MKVEALTAPGSVLDPAGAAARAAMMVYVTSVLTALEDSGGISLRW